MEETNLVGLFDFGRQVNRFRFTWACRFFLPDVIPDLVVSGAMGALADSLRQIVDPENRVQEEARLDELQQELSGCLSEQFCCDVLEEFWSPESPSDDCENRLVNEIEGFLNLIEEWQASIGGRMSVLGRSIVNLGTAVDQIVRPNAVSIIGRAIVEVHESTAVLGGYVAQTREQLALQTAGRTRRMTELLHHGVLPDGSIALLEGRQCPQNVRSNVDQSSSARNPLLLNQASFVSQAVAVARRRFLDVSERLPGVDSESWNGDQVESLSPSALADYLAGLLTDAARRIVSEVASTPTETTEAEQRYLGIELNEEAVTLRRSGFDTPIRLANCPEAWHVIRELVRARHDGLTRAQRRNLERHREPAAWRRLKCRLNELLTPVNLHISRANPWILSDGVGSAT